MIVESGALAGQPTDQPDIVVRALFDALDRFSLEQKRAVTLPLLRAMLVNEFQNDLQNDLADDRPE